MSQNCHSGLRLACCGAEGLGMLESLGQQEFWWSWLASNRGDRQSGKELTMTVKDIRTTHVYLPSLLPLAFSEAFPRASGRRCRPGVAAGGGCSGAPGGVQPVWGHQKAVCIPYPHKVS